VLSQENLKQTPLKESHLKLNARLVPFGGWEMPLQYEGILAEHNQTRNSAAMFDISHMGEFVIEGDCIESGLDSIVTPEINDMPEKSCRYGAMLNEQGGIIDDLIVFRINAEQWMIVVNGATTETDASHFEKHITNKGRFTDISKQIGKIDVQGPLSREVLSSMVDNIKKLDYYTFDEFNVLGEDVIVSRTGYTGELGYEIYFPWDKIEELWNEILKCDKVKPAGLGARDILRLEMGYSLYGHELNDTITPLEAGLMRFIDLNKNFLGKEALEKQKAQGPKKKIASFMSNSRRSPRQGHKIFSRDEKEIGLVTSGTFSPSLGCGIGMGYVDTQSIPQEGTIFLGEGKNRFEAKTSKRPFYTNGSLKN